MQLEAVETYLVRIFNISRAIQTDNSNQMSRHCHHRQVPPHDRRLTDDLSSIQQLALPIEICTYYYGGHQEPPS